MSAPARADNPELSPSAPGLERPRLRWRWFNGFGGFARAAAGRKRTPGATSSKPSQDRWAFSGATVTLPALVQTPPPLEADLDTKACLWNGSGRPGGWGAAATWLHFKPGMVTPWTAIRRIRPADWCRGFVDTLGLRGLQLRAGRSCPMDRQRRCSLCDPHAHTRSAQAGVRPGCRHRRRQA